MLYKLPNCGTSTYSEDPETIEDGWFMTGVCIPKFYVHKWSCVMTILFSSPKSHLFMWLMFHSVTLDEIYKQFSLIVFIIWCEKKKRNREEKVVSPFTPITLQKANRYLNWYLRKPFRSLAVSELWAHWILSPSPPTVSMSLLFWVHITSNLFRRTLPVFSSLWL